MGNGRIQHGLSETPEWSSWSCMHGRCSNPSNHKYYRYGERGISVCERWTGKYGFLNFLNDMGSKPTPRHTVDRIDNNGDYEPDNCRWATPKEQARNRNKHSNNCSGISGISFIQRRKKWAVSLSVKKLGRYSDFFEACCARKSAENKHWRNV